jgi:hypothetical protein
MTINDRTLTEVDLDRVSGGLRDKPDQDRLNHLSRMDGGGWGAAIGGNWMMGGKDAHLGGQIGNNIPVNFNPDGPF